MYIFQPDRYLLRKQIEGVAHYIRGRVLDIGAGERNRYADLFKASEYVTMDVHSGSNVQIVGSIEAVPAEAESFDSIVCTQVLEHVPHPVQAIKELHRVLKPGGHVLVTVPQVAELHEEPNDFFRYTPFGLEKLFGETGFHVVEKMQRGGFFATRAQMNIRYAMDRWQLFSRPFLGRIGHMLFKVCGSIALWRDGRDTSIANRKHAIGWTYIFQK